MKPKPASSAHLPSWERAFHVQPFHLPVTGDTARRGSDVEQFHYLCLCNVVPAATRALNRGLRVRQISSRREPFSYFPSVGLCAAKRDCGAALRLHVRERRELALETNGRTCIESLGTHRVAAIALRALHSARRHAFENRASGSATSLRVTACNFVRENEPNCASRATAIQFRTLVHAARRSCNFVLHVANGIFRAAVFLSGAPSDFAGRHIGTMMIVLTPCG